MVEQLEIRSDNESEILSYEDAFPSELKADVPNVASPTQEDEIPF